jgi:hypothetical protein
MAKVMDGELKQKALREIVIKRMIIVSLADGTLMK